MATSKYEKYMLAYERIRNENFMKLEDRKAEAYEKIPGLRELSEKMASASITYARAKLRKEPLPFISLPLYLDTCKNEQNQLLKEHGYPIDYFEPIYTCKSCKDTGFINGTECQCLKQQIIGDNFQQSLITRSLEVENFENFDLSYYSKEKDGTHSKSPYDHMVEVLNMAHGFVDDFDTKGGNLILRGKSSLGKTYLSNCIAKALLDKGHTVLYLSAIKLFEEIMPGVLMNRNNSAENKSIYEYVYDCDLLIIDDLGTEFLNNLTLPYVFDCINGRLLSGKSTIISTNFELEELKSRYSERIFSRWIDNYTIYEFYGANIRYQKRSNRIQAKRDSF